MPREQLHRTAVRVLLFNHLGEICLLHGTDKTDHSGNSWWYTLGGGQDDGESLQAAAIREVHEEIGLQLTETDVVGPFHQDYVEFPFDTYYVCQEQHYFAAHISHWTPDLTRMTSLEKANTLTVRWWHVAALTTTTETIYPHNLGALCDQAQTQLAKKSS